MCGARLPRGLHQDVEVECGAAQQGQGGVCAQVPAVGGEADQGLGLLLRLTPVNQPRHTTKCNIYISDSKIIFTLRALYPIQCHPGGNLFDCLEFSSEPCPKLIMLDYVSDKLAHCVMTELGTKPQYQ